MDYEVIFGNINLYIEGLWVTIQLVFLALVLGFVIALPIALIGTSRYPWIRLIPKAYIYFFRGTPLLVQIFIIYFGLGQIEYLRSTVLWVILKEPYWCAIIAFALNTGAYTSEILRSAFQTIKPGIIEAGKSLGISNKVIFYKIQIPIAIRQSLPAFKPIEVFIVAGGIYLFMTFIIHNVIKFLEKKYSFN